MLPANFMCSEIIVIRLQTRTLIVSMLMQCNGQASREAEEHSSRKWAFGVTNFIRQIGKKTPHRLSISSLHFLLQTSIDTTRAGERGKQLIKNHSAGQHRLSSASCPMDLDEMSV